MLVVVCLCTPVLLSVPKVESTYVTWEHPFLRMLIWWSLCIVELPYVIQVSVVVSLVCRALLLPFVRQPLCNPLWLTGLKAPTN